LTGALAGFCLALQTQNYSSSGLITGIAASLSRQHRSPCPLELTGKRMMENSALYTDLAMYLPCYSYYSSLPVLHPISTALEIHYSQQ
jgi:hypothetical protein